MLWKMPVTWEMCAYIQVEATTLEQAMEIARDPDGKIPLPADGAYVDGSWTLSSADTGYLEALQEAAQKHRKDDTQ